MFIETYAGSFAITNPLANVTTNGFTNPVPKLATPTGDGVLNIGQGTAGICPSAVMLVPYGIGSDTNTFSMNVYGWSPTIPVGTGKVALWLPVVLATFTGCTLNSGMPGLTTTDFSTSTYFCSDITLAVGNSGISVEVVSPAHATNKIAHILLDAKGFRYLFTDFSTGGSATSCNCLWKRM